MGIPGKRRRTVRRLVVVAWALAVAVTGGLTLWMQDSTEPRGPYVWEETGSGDAQHLPPCPTPQACAYGTTP
ncbi:hypothetical protein G3M58_83190 [Streptomyces sp. SID7499]|uniref:Uncharacterized protein n=1 Tax=Streptomyces sp. SID7499 TaxID=2706086 RepID=A0A6G3XTB5_9ACTN|nr:hypothetical protein [Streptomyces sp. SID7499]